LLSVCQFLPTVRFYKPGTPEAVYQNPAHQFVGHFLGSPGMNFLPSNAFPQRLQRSFAEDGDPETIGFRPESAGLTAPSEVLLSGIVETQRVLGTAQGRVVSMYGLRCGAAQGFCALACILCSRR
jgi:ABC-type sugar transport system ATPase subunit